MLKKQSYPYLSGTYHRFRRHKNSAWQTFCNVIGRTGLEIYPDFEFRACPLLTGCVEPGHPVFFEPLQLACIKHIFRVMAAKHFTETPIQTHPRMHTRRWVVYHTR